MFSYCIFLIAKKGGFPDGLKINYEVQDFFYRKKVMCVYLRDLCVCYCFIDFLFHHLAMGWGKGVVDSCARVCLLTENKIPHTKNFSCKRFLRGDVTVKW